MANTVIRASSLPGYIDCPRRWAARTLSSEIKKASYSLNNIPSSVGASVGTATHTGAAFLLTEKMKTGELGNQTEAEQRSLEDYEKQVREGVQWDEATSSFNEGQSQVRNMVKVFRNTTAIEIQPVMVERRLEANVGDGFVLSGQSDMQTVEPGRIRDLKTGRFPRRHFGQLGAYSLLARTAFKDLPVKEVCVDFIQRVSVKKIQPAPVTDFYDMVVAENAAASAIERIKSDVTNFRARLTHGHKPPEYAFLANPASMMCSPKWCSAFGTDFCREHKEQTQKGAN